MNAFAYIRVSGAAQVEKDGPERQADKINKFCEAQGLVLGRSYREDGVSGTVEGMERPKFSEMLEQITYVKNREEFSACIVVENMDRLARDLMVSEVLLRECRLRGIPVYAVDQGALVDMANDGGEPTRKLLRQIMGALAEWEKSTLVRKLRAARDRKREACGRCEGPLPFGSFPPEIDCLREMKEGANFGYSLTENADRLNELGFRTRTGRFWNKQTVNHILGNRREKRKKESCTAVHS